MGGLFGKGTSAKQPTAAGSLQFQSAQRGGVIPLVYGTTRVAVNVLDYDDFHTTRVNASTVGKGKGGVVGAITGKGQQSQPQVTEYIASFILGVCQGPITNTGQAWYDKFLTTVTQVPFVDSVNFGADGQAPDPYWTANHASKAIGYSGTMNVVLANYNFGPSSTLPNFSFEIYAILSSSGVNGMDADPSQVILDFLTNSRYGANFPLANWWPTNTDATNPTSYASYVRALGLWLSVSLETQQEAQRHLDILTKLTNSEVVWSGGLLKIIPRGDTQVVGAITSNSSWTITLSGGDASGTDTVTVTISDPVLGTRSASTQTIAGEHLPDIGRNLIVSLDSIIPQFNILVTNVVNAQTPPVGPPPLSQNNTAIVTISMIQNPPTGTTVVSVSGPSIDFLAAVSTTASGGVGTFTPNNTPIYSLGEDDFITQESSVGAAIGPNPGGTALRSGGTPITGGFVDDPVHVARSSPADADNVVRIECLDRGAYYNTTIVEVQDQSLVDTYGLRVQSSINARAIVDPGYIGYTVAQLLLQRSVLYRNTYTFQLGWRYILLEPMDLVQITDSRLGISALTVRVTAVEENEEGLLTVTAEDYFGAYSPTVLYPGTVPVALTPTVLGVGGSAVAPKAPQLNAGMNPVLSTMPSSVNPPIIFEPTPALVTSEQGLELWIALSGPSPEWGGAQVWVSTDGSTYTSFGSVNGPSAMGVTTTLLPFYGGANPDTADGLGVNLTESAGSLMSTSAANAAAGVTLCYVGGELLSYQTATLTALHKYTLTTLWRGQFGSTVLNVPSNAPFVAIGANIGRFAYPSSFIGQTIYFKFLSVNFAGSMPQSLSQVTAYPFTPTGSSKPVTGTTVSGSYSGPTSPNLVVGHYVFTKTVNFPVGLAGSKGAAGVAATSLTTYNIQKNGANVGTMAFAASATTATFTLPTATQYVAGDVLQVVAPASPDATLANLAWTFTGTFG